MGPIFEILGGFDRGPSFDDFGSGPKNEKNVKKRSGDVKRGFGRQGSAEHPGSPKSFGSLQSQADSSEFVKNLGRPVPCEQGAADYYLFGSSADPLSKRPAASDLRGFL